MPRLRYILLGALVALLAWGAPIASFAAVTSCDAETIGILPTCICTGRGPCQMLDFLNMIVNLSNWILGIISGLTVTMLVIAGLMLMLSGGYQNLRQRAIEWIRSILVGAGFTLGAWVMVNTLMLALKGIDPSAKGTPWNEIPNSTETCQQRALTEKGNPDYDCFTTVYYQDLIARKVENAECLENADNYCLGAGSSCCNKNIKLPN